MKPLGVMGAFTAFFPVPQPPFLHMEPVQTGTHWILAAWLPFFGLNIAGEELMWRGYLLPRQELAFGRHAWLFNAGLWGLFHVAFGALMIVMLAPILLVVPWIVSRRQNTAIGLLIHGLVNGAGFLAVAFGLAH